MTLGLIVIYGEHGISSTFYVYTNIVSAEYYDPVAATDSTFLPIPEVRLDDALTAIYFLSAQNVQFLTPVDNDWYSAHEVELPGTQIDTDNQIPIYHADRAATPLGCALKARDSLFSDWQGPLPSKQWRQEVLFWEKISLTAAQRAAVKAVTGPSDPSVQQYVQKNVPGLIDDFCVEQKTRSTAYTSFSVLGLTITLVVGALVIAISNFIEPFCTCIWQKKHLHRRLEWVTNETLHLQRTIQEKLGLGTWSAASSSSVPVTEKDEKFGILDVSNKEYPIMVRPLSNADTEDINGGLVDITNLPSSQGTANEPVQGFDSDHTFSADSATASGIDRPEEQPPHTEDHPPGVEEAKCAPHTILPLESPNDGAQPLCDEEKLSSMNAILRNGYGQQGPSHTSSALSEHSVSGH
ncbi:MAG: hypothetical protein Q9160_002704 [Pyrenula sp. 1 TL-2023]